METETIGAVNPSSSSVSINVSIDEVLRKLHSISGVSRSCESLPIRRYLQIAMSHLDTWSIEIILKHYPYIVTARNEENGNLPIHDIVHQYFDVKGALEEDESEMRHYLLQSRISRVKEILNLYIKFGIQFNIGGRGIEGGGGLFDLNQEQIDFVTTRRRTPLQIFLSKFELILIHCNKFTFDIDERRKKNALLEQAKSCFQFCIDIAKKAWKVKGCTDPFTIMNVAVEVFPLLEVGTIEYILHKFDQVSTHDDPNSKTYPLHYKDLEDRTILTKAIHEATKRKQLWGDWKSRFEVILFDNNKRRRCEQCWFRDKDGRLPIHIAIDKGLEWDNGLQELAEVDPVTLLEPDPISGLQPFSHAAARTTYLTLSVSKNISPSNPLHSSSKKSSAAQISHIMNLILTNPAVIPRVPFTKGMRKRGRALYYSSPVRRSKRLIGQHYQKCLKSSNGA